MAFDQGALSTLSEEISDPKRFIYTPILGAKTMDYLDKYNGIFGQNYRLPTFETTAPWQAATGCSYTTSGTTTNSQFTLPTVPIAIQEAICPKDLWAEHTYRWADSKNDPDTVDIVSQWIERKMAVHTRNLEQAIWKSNTTTGPGIATFLKQFNGLIQRIDAATDEVIVTAQASISTSTIRTIVEEFVFDDIPNRILDMEPILFMSYEHFRMLLQKLYIDNMYHVPPASTGTASKMEMIYPGSNVKIVAVPGLNSNSTDVGVETGALTTAMQNRMFATYKGNFAVGLGIGEGKDAFEVWYSQDDRVIRCSMTFHIGFGIKQTNNVVSYLNT